MGSIKGDLDVLGLADLLQLLVQHRRIGTLIVSDGDSRKSMHFGQEGLLLLSTGERKGPRLGEMLLLTKRLTFPQVARALESQKQWKVPFGESVVRLGYLPQEEISQALLEQFEEELCDLFFWSGATFEFIEGPPPQIFRDPDQPVAVITRDVSGLILEAMRRIDEWRQFNAQIGGERTVFALTDTIGKHTTDYAEDPFIGMVAQFIDGKNPVEAIVREAGVSRFQVFRILARLLQDGSIQRSVESATGVLQRVDAKLPSAPTVLVVSSAQQFRQNLCDALRASGYNVVLASHAESALDTMKRYAISLLLLDVPYPIKTGLATLAQLRQATDRPILALSPPNHAVQLRLRATGARECVARPFAMEPLIEQVKALVEADSEAPPPLPAGGAPQS
jgi:two-component system cell cycle response regulator DivK